MRQTNRISAVCSTVACLLAGILFQMAASSTTGIAETTFTYKNELEKIADPLPVLADHPDFVESLETEDRFLAPPVINEAGGGLLVRSWRYWYNARGIIEMENRLDARATAIINLSAWGVDDGGGFRSPEPSGIVLAGTPEKNALFVRQVEEVVNPFLTRLSTHVELVAHTLPGSEDSIRKILYPSITTIADDLDITRGTRLLKDALAACSFSGLSPKESLDLEKNILLTDYFLKTPSSHAAARFNGAGFDNVPVPLVKNIVRSGNDLVFYDGDGYARIRDYLKERGIRHLLVLGFIEKPTILPTHPRAETGSAEQSGLGKIGSALTIGKLKKDLICSWSAMLSARLFPEA